MQEFTTPAPITAILDIPAGRIQFTAADRAGTTVEIRPADPSKGRDVKLAVSQVLGPNGCGLSRTWRYSSSATSRRRRGAC
jgi:hypothetical protein